MDNQSSDPDIWEGMFISWLLERMPKEEWVEPPTIQREEGTDKLIITYHYQDYDVVLEWAESKDDEGNVRLQGYFIQEIYLMEDEEVDDVEEN